MFWKTKPTIDEDDLDWQLEAWSWLLQHLGGVERLSIYPTLVPSSDDFPPSGKTGAAHAKFVVGQVASWMDVDRDRFRIELQEQNIDPILGPLAVAQNVPQNPLGTYSGDWSNRETITLDPTLLSDLQNLIATCAHELCHGVLRDIAVPPPGGWEMEEFLTDLTVAYFGFGVFGGNTSFQFSQMRDVGHGTQGWSMSKAGYLTRNEWGFALAIRSAIGGESLDRALRYASRDLAAHVRQNAKYLAKNPDVLDTFKSARRVDQ